MGWDPFGTSAAKKIKQASAAAAEAAREKGEAEAAALRFNAAVYANNAAAVEEQGLIDEARNRRQGSRFLGEQDAAIASSGFADVGFGDLRETTEAELDLDAIIIRRQGQARAADFNSQAELALMGAETALRAGEAGARMAILNGSLQAQQAQNAAIGGTIGTATTAAAIYFSDARVKENIEPVGVLPTGDRLYAFNYVWEYPAQRRVGVMAQEVRERVPAAVSLGDDGILMVDYAKLGLPAGYDLRNAIKRGRR
jgi:hypothetical protein